MACLRAMGDGKGIPMIQGKRLVVGLIAAACCGWAALAVTGGANGADGATGPGQIRITDVQLNIASQPGPRGGKGGTVQMIRQRLYNTRITERAIGRSLLVCTLSNARDRICTGTYILPKGTLVVTGVLQSRLFYEIPVVGGTGLYDNARGTLTVTATHFKPRHEVLFFRLVG
jgi:hypothetical protein